MFVRMCICARVFVCLCALVRVAPFESVCVCVYACFCLCARTYMFVRVVAVCCVLVRFLRYSCLPDLCMVTY